MSKVPYRECWMPGGTITMSRHDGINGYVVIKRLSSGNMTNHLLTISQNEARSLANEIIALLDDDLPPDDPGASERGG